MRLKRCVSTCAIRIPLNSDIIARGNTKSCPKLFKHMENIRHVSYMSYWKSPEDYVLSSSENNLLTTTGNFCGPRSLKLTKIFLVVSRKRILTATGVSDKLLPGVAAMLAGSDIAQHNEQLATAVEYP